MSRARRIAARRTLSLAVATVAFAGTASAATWNSTTGGNWNLTTAAGWNGAYPDGIDAIADVSTQNITAGQTLTLNVSPKIGSLLLGDATTGSHGWTVSATSPNKLTLEVSSGSASITSSGWDHTVSAPIQLNSSVLVTSSTSGRGITLSGVISESGGVYSLTTSGVGSVTINGNNSFSGGVSLGGSGTVTAGHANAFGSGGITITANTNIGVASGITVSKATITESSGAYNFTKSNSGTLVLSGAAGWTGTTSVTGGVLRVTDSSAISSANLVLNAGTLELGAADFTRGLGTGAGQVQFGSNGGGFSAFGGNREVNIGGSTATLQFGGTSFIPNDRSLLLSSSTSDSTVTLRNGLDLNGRYRAVNVGNGTAAVDAVLAGSLGGTSTNAGLVKFGLGTLRLDATNTFAGGTLVQQGTVIANATNAIPNWVGVAAGDPNDLNGGPKAAYLQADVANAVGGSVFVAAGGAVRAKNINPARIEVLPGGGVAYDAAADLPASLGTRFNGTNLVANYAVDQDFVDRVAATHSGAIALGADSANNLDLTGKTGVRLGAWDPLALSNSAKPFIYSGTITPAGDTYRLGGGNAELKVASALTGAGRNLDVAMGADAVATSVQQAYNRKPMILPGRVTLTANNDLTGTTTVGAYTLAKLEGASGALSGTTAININGGQLYLRDSSGATNNARLNDAAPITFNRGGILRFDGNNAQTENVGSVSLASGQAYIVTGRGTGSGTPVLALAGLTRTKGATVDFVLNNSNTNSAITIAGTPALAGWATVGWGGNFAKYSGSSIASMSGADYNTGAETTWSTSTPAVQMGADVTLTGNRTVNNFKRNGGAALNLGTNTLTLNQGGLLFNGSTTISNGSLTAGTSAGSDYELFVISGNGFNVTISAGIVDNGANPVTLVRSNGSGYTNGDYALILSGTNSYTGGTYLNWGSTQFNSDSAFGGGTIYAVGYAHTDVNNWSSFTRMTQLASGGTGTRTISNALVAKSDAQLNGNNNIVWNGQITLENGSGLILGGSPSTNITSRITGTGYVRVDNSTAATFFSGTVANDYTGPTYVTNTSNNVFYLNKTAGVDAIPAGGLVIGGFQGNETGFANYNNRVVQLQARDQINNAATVSFVGGVGNQAVLRLDRYNETVAGLSSVLGAGIVENSNATAANVSTLTVTGAGTYEFGGVLQNGGTAKLNFVKDGAGTQILNGANTYTGTTVVNNGKLIVNGSLAAGSDVTINGGSLGGSGTIGGATTIVAGANLAPGNSAGILNTGTITIAGTLLAEINGDAVGTEYDQVNVVGGVTLGGNLSIALGYVPSDNTPYTLINNDGTDAISGVFASINGAAPIPVAPNVYTFSQNAWTWQINYAGGTDNNDVVITAVIPEPGTVMLALGVIGASCMLRKRQRHDVSEA